MDDKTLIGAFLKSVQACNLHAVLAYPEIGKQFILDTDASHESIGAVLSQEIDGQERVIAYFTQLARHRPFPSYNEALLGSLGLSPRNGVLFRNWESDDGKTFRWQLILPKIRVSTVLKELHGSPTGGHFGVMKTLQKVRERFYWNNVWSDVEKCCRICDPCASRKGTRKRTRGRLQLYNVGAPFERIAFDVLGSLPRSSDGSNNILVVMDYFTKLPEAYLIPDQEASTVAEVLVQHWISRSQLHSDQGRNFDSAVCKRLCEILAIDKTRTTALHPQSDGMVERSAVHETSGYSPSQMLFGSDLRLPADLLFSRPPDAPMAPKEYIEKLQERMEEMHHLSRERIGMAAEKMKTRYDARATGHDFREDDKVWLWNPKRRKGLPPKLQTNWEGPYTVLKRLNDVVVRIQKSPHSEPKVIHYNRLAPYLGQD
ncbi:retrovirus-related Pol polyprotein from transposon 412 [Trichonephila clavipes]|nr:retrovirus-related Pol polyprotein from transposon 412 [Trichonephila clavipes]